MYFCWYFTLDALLVKLKELETEKAQTEYLLNELEHSNQQKEFTAAEIKHVFTRIRKLLKAGTLDTIKGIIDKFVSKIVINPDGVIVHFYFFPDFTIKLEEQTEKDHSNDEQSISDDPTKMADEIGGTGGS